jgi:two-component system response regulator
VLVQHGVDGVRFVNINAILLVEDNPNDEVLTLRAIRKCNIRNEIVVARDGIEALDQLFPNQGQENGSSALPKLVLLDLKLPKIDGLEVLRRIRGDARTRLLPVVIFSSSREQMDVAQAYAFGANSYVCKPVDFGEFASAVARLSQYWTLVNEPPLNSRPV